MIWGYHHVRKHPYATVDGEPGKHFVGARVFFRSSPMEPPQPGEWQCPSPDLSSGDTKNGCCEYQHHWEGDLISIDGGKTKKHQQTAELHRKNLIPVPFQSSRKFLFLITFHHIICQCPDLKILKSTKSTVTTPNLRFVR